MTSDRSAKRYYGELRYRARADVTMSASTLRRRARFAVKREVRTCKSRWKILLTTRDGRPRVPILSRIVDCSEVSSFHRFRDVMTFIRALAPDKNISPTVG